MNKSFSQKGMSLTELIISMAVFGLIVVAVTTFTKDVIVNNRFANDSLSTLEDTKVILRTLVRELRTASPSNNGAFPIIAVSTSTISFYSDTDGDGLKEQIRYFLSTTNLKKGVIKPTGSPSVYNSGSETVKILANNIKNSSSTPIFTYYDSTYAGTSTPLTYPISLSNIHLVKIDLTIDIDPSRSPIPRTYTTQVSLRNLKDNL